MKNRCKNGILSFDVSSVSTGWSYLVRDKLKDYGVVKPPTKCSPPEKLVYFHEHVTEVLKKFNPTYIIVEDTYLKNVKTLKVLMQFIGVLVLDCYIILKIIPFIVSPNTVRSKYTVRKKEDVFQYVIERYKLDMNFEKDNDITDSILQGLYCYEYLVK